MLGDLVHTQIEPFVEGEGKRLSISGPRVVLDEPATQSVGLALHELATNAAKYGALSVPQGRVTIEWELAGEPGEARRLLLRWRERNGPQGAGAGPQGIWPYRHGAHTGGQPAG